MTDSDKIKTLPLPFLERMKEMLGDDYNTFLQSYENPRTYGLRINTANFPARILKNFPPLRSDRSRGSPTDISTMRKADRHAAPTIRPDFIISRNQVP